MNGKIIGMMVFGVLLMLYNGYKLYNHSLVEAKIVDLRKSEEHFLVDGTEYHIIDVYREDIGITLNSKVRADSYLNFEVGEKVGYPYVHTENEMSWMVGYILGLVFGLMLFVIPIVANIGEGEVYY